MAAVAGSKGKIASSCGVGFAKPARPSFQASLVSRLLASEITPECAVNEMLSHSKLREIGVDTNMTCNLRCRYCYLDDRPIRKAELDAMTWTAILKPLILNGCKLVAFIGKEPLLDGIAIDVLERLAQIRKRGISFRTGMVTNGTLLDRYAERVFNAELSYLDISLDGLPQVNDLWRGEGVAKTVLQNITNYIAYRPKHDVFVSSVLHRGNIEHITDYASHLFNIGVPGFFTSPILKFTTDGRIQEWSVTLPEVLCLIRSLLRLAERYQLAPEQQIVIDLPYRYAWRLIASGEISEASVCEDVYEVPFWKPDPALPVFVKMNLLSYSYWKAVRITHDGTVIKNMDLAAHEDYNCGTEKADLNGNWAINFASHLNSHRFHSRFFGEHILSAAGESLIYERDVHEQLRSEQLTCGS